MRGTIRHPAKYLADKAFDHSGWSKVLPRNITPSDGDMIFDNRKRDRMLFVEVKPFVGWLNEGLAWGQYATYEHLVKIGQGKIYAVIAQPIDRAIDWPDDVMVSKIIDKRIDTTQMLAFQVMYYHNGAVALADIQDGDKWVDTVIDLMEFDK